jgi:hypothetical protein
MRGQGVWNFKPYSRLNEMYKREYPYICRLEPGQETCIVDWFDNGEPGVEHSIRYQQKAADNPPVTLKAEGTPVKLTSLKPGCEYEVTVFRAKDPDKKSDTRRFRTGSYPGKIINYLHPHDNIYAFSGHCLSSPSLVRADSGRLLVSMDVFDHGTPQNLTIICKSDDEGVTWQYVCEILPSFWGRLFCHQGRIYLLSFVNEYGDLQIGCSEDEGLRWSKPVTILPGSGNGKEPGMHGNVVPVVSYKNRLWTGVEYGAWPRGYHDSGVLSIAEDAELMKPENWSCTEFLRFNPEWEAAVRNGGLNFIEGNVVAGPDGSLYNILRDNNNTPADGNLGRAVILKVNTDNPDKQLEFVRIIDFNGGSTKFMIHRDEKTGVYYSIVNRVTGPQNLNQRNIASLAISRDMIHWKIAKDLIDGSDGAPEEVGFQYIVHIPLGDDLVYVSRTAYNHARNFHDSNCITFHREKNFRRILTGI